jgi:hypothetical protein
VFKPGETWWVRLLGMPGIKISRGPSSEQLGISISDMNLAFGNRWTGVKAPST